MKKLIGIYESDAEEGIDHLRLVHISKSKTISVKSGPKVTYVKRNIVRISWVVLYIVHRVLTVSNWHPRSVGRAGSGVSVPFYALHIRSCLKARRGLP